jgi:hypothetical protein
VRIADRRAGDVHKQHLDDGLPSEDAGPTERGEKSEVPLVLNLGGCTPAGDGSEHICDVGVGMFLLEDTGVGERNWHLGRIPWRGRRILRLARRRGDGRATKSWY